MSLEKTKGFDAWFSRAYENQRLDGPLAVHMRAAWEAALLSQRDPAKGLRDIRLQRLKNFFEGK